MGGNPLADLAWFAGDREIEDVEPTLKGRPHAQRFLSCVFWNFGHFPVQPMLSKALAHEQS